MINITVKWNVKPEKAEGFLDAMQEFTDACRAEPGCLWFEWARSVDDPNEFVLLEAYRDKQAAKEHVESDHFKKAMTTPGDFLTARPKIVSFEVPQDGWNELAEIQMPNEK